MRRINDVVAFMRTPGDARQATPKVFLRRSGARRKHPVDRREMASRISQYFSVGGMIGILNGDDGAAQLRVLAAQKACELLFGLRGSDHQNFMYAFERVRDL